MTGWNQPERWHVIDPPIWKVMIVLPSVLCSISVSSELISCSCSSWTAFKNMIEPFCSHEADKDKANTQSRENSWKISDTELESFAEKVNKAVLSHTWAYRRFMQKLQMSRLLTFHLVLHIFPQIDNSSSPTQWTAAGELKICQPYHSVSIVQMS